MKRPARHRSSPMERALNPQAQQHCDAFSKHGLWRCECTGQYSTTVVALDITPLPKDITALQIV